MPFLAARAGDAQVMDLGRGEWDLRKLTELAEVFAL